MTSSMALRPPQPSAVPVPPVTALPTPPAASVDIGALKINVPPPVVPSAAVANAGRDQEAQLVRRVRELEEEVRVVRAENEKQVSFDCSKCEVTRELMANYREL